MKLLHVADIDFKSNLKLMRNNCGLPLEIEKDVAAILKNVRTIGDLSIIEYAKRYDNVDLNPPEFQLNTVDIESAASQLDSKIKDAIRKSHDNIRSFSEQFTPQSWHYSPRLGVKMGERFVPLNRVVAYIPGGNVPLVSTVIHTVTLAKVAGVKEIIITTPVGPTKLIHPAIRYAASIAGASAVYRLGGVYAIGAFAYGTETIAKVDKIVGPGNAYVSTAKKLVYGSVGIDMIAGPSEIAIIADNTANPGFVAADMLAQAEHGSGYELSILVTNSTSLISKVKEEIYLQVHHHKNPDQIKQVIDHGFYLISVNNLNEALQVINEIAPEHVEIMTENARELAAQITTAGAIFIGPWTPEPVGDYIAGPSHVLPTGGTATFFSGLTTGQFLRRISVIEYDRNALLDESGAICDLAGIEDLPGHQRAIAIRNHPRS